MSALVREASFVSRSHCRLTGHGPLTSRGRAQTCRHLSVTTCTSPARTNRRHWALTDSRPFTNLTRIILHVVNLIILRVVDLHVHEH